MPNELIGIVLPWALAGDFTPNAAWLAGISMLRGELPDTVLDMFSLMFIILYMYIILYNCIWRTSIEKTCFTYQCMSLMLHSDAQPRTIVYWGILWTIVTWSSCDADPTHTNKSWSSHSPNLRASNWWKFPETSHALSKMSHMQVGPHAQIPWFGSQ
jgi:hypothetical protein